MSDLNEKINEAIDLLRANGYRIERPEWGPWINATALHAQFGHLSRTAFHKRLYTFAGDFPRSCGPRGNLRRLRTTPELLAWLGQPIEPGKRNDLATEGRDA